MPTRKYPNSPGELTFWSNLAKRFSNWRIDAVAPVDFGPGWFWSRGHHVGTGDVEGEPERLVRSFLGVLDQCFSDEKHVYQCTFHFFLCNFCYLLRKEINPRKQKVRRQRKRKLERKRQKQRKMRNLKKKLQKKTRTKNRMRERMRTNRKKKVKKMEKERAMKRKKKRKKKEKRTERRKKNPLKRKKTATNRHV